MSGSIITSALYFLWRIMQFPEIGNVDATLIGVSVTCAIFLCAYGIGSGRGNPVESSLLVSFFHGGIAYKTLCEEYCGTNDCFLLILLSCASNALYCKSKFIHPSFT
jgi:ICE2